MSPENWEIIFNGIEDPFLVVRPDGIIIEANEAALKAARKTKQDVVGQGICKIIHGGRWPHIECPLEVFLKNCTSRIEETRLPGLHGEYFLSISPVKGENSKIDKILLIARELTSNEIRKVDYFRNANLAALGELAAGVAHEVNNPITGVINFAQILIDNFNLEPAGVDIANKIIKEGERIAAITKNLISFAREDVSLREPVNFIEIIKASLSLVTHQLQREGIKIITDFPDCSVVVVADFKKIQQIILNIISNSRYALNVKYPNFDDKKIIEIFCSEKFDTEKPFYRLIIKDYGTGLPQSLLEHIFEPFFSTKPPGQGTGLGLSISYGIVKEHGGSMRVNSVINNFTEMIIEMPAAS